MQLNTVIFDMDGLLIDSEPLWGEAADEVFAHYQLKLTRQQHHMSTGLRTIEFVKQWFEFFGADMAKVDSATNAIHEVVIKKIKTQGKPMPGVEHIFNFFLQRNFKVGLASSSHLSIIDVIVDKLGIRHCLQAICSASALPYGKPHPQVYLDCAALLATPPTQCLCFEDSFNGMIAAKAARMKCVVVPALHDSKDPRFGAADLKISSLQNFNELLMQGL
jgi:mannitol-1-/sugar-/sorbitol-6-/2-deoxyglucose-6-phosphatase